MTTGPELQSSLGYLLKAAHKAFVATLSKELEPYGVTAGQWAIFRALWEEENLSQAELADRMGIERASLTSVLNVLVEKGFVTRLRNQQDRRKINVGLTEAGRQLRDDLLPLGVVTVTEAATRGIPDDAIDACRETIQQMIENLQDYVAGGRDVAPGSGGGATRWRSETPGGSKAA